MVARDAGEAVSKPEAVTPDGMVTAGSGILSLNEIQCLTLLWESRRHPREVSFGAQEWLWPGKQKHLLLWCVCLGTII